MFLAEVRVGFKRGVADPEGENTRKALTLLGFEDVASVRAAKVFEIELEASSEDAAREEVERMCARLLANPVVNEYAIAVSKR